jgi:lysozyme
MSTANAQGIDVSHFQGTVNWPSVKTAGAVFAFAKATEGVTYTDPEFTTNWAGIKNAGLLRGAYHFFLPADDAAQQADFFLSKVQIEAGDLPPVLDVETAPTSGQDLWGGVQTWLEQVEAATGVQPILYMSPGFADEYGAPASLAAYPYWVAEYGVDQPSLPTGWTTWLLWQYTQTGTVSGVVGHVDRDEVNGPITELLAIVKK